LFRPEAEADILKVALWYEGEAGLGLELSAEIRAAIDRAVRIHSHILRLRERPDVRRVLAHRFPYRIFYIVRDDAVDSLRSSACLAS